MLPCYEKWEQLLTQSEIRGDIFPTKISTKNASASCCGSKDARPSNGGRFEEYHAAVLRFLDKEKTGGQTLLILESHLRKFMQGSTYVYTGTATALFQHTI